jgi:hypothetical protein
MNPLIRENRYSGLEGSRQSSFVPDFYRHSGVGFYRGGFLRKPELLTGIQRAIPSGMEIVGDNIPPPWGPRIEFVFREIGGFIWLQITLIVVALRVLLSGIAGLWRLLRRDETTL